MTGGSEQEPTRTPVEWMVLGWFNVPPGVREMVIVVDKPIGSYALGYIHKKEQKVNTSEEAMAKLRRVRVEQAIESLEHFLKDSDECDRENRLTLTPLLMIEENPCRN